MKLTSIDLSNPKQTINVSLNTPAVDEPYLIKAIVGLDADELVSRFYNRGLAQPTGEYYGLYDIVLPKREVVINVMMNPRYPTGETFSKLRDMMYKMISGGRYGTLDLKFKDGSTVVAKLTGYITKLETPQFSDVQELTITMLCRDPMLRGVTEQLVGPTHLNTYQTKTAITDNSSTAWHGLRLAVQFNNDNDDTFRIWNVSEGWEFYIYFSYGFKAGDRLRISTEYNKKYVTLNGIPGDPRYGTIVSAAGIPLTSIADKVEPFTTGWPIMFPGVNNFNFDATNYTWMGMWYYHAYWGV